MDDHEAPAAPVLWGGRGLKPGPPHAPPRRSPAAPVLWGGRGLKHQHASQWGHRALAAPVLWGGRGLKQGTRIVRTVGATQRPSSGAGED